VSLRSGTLLHVSADGKEKITIQNTPSTYVESQGGYFDVVLDPGFAENQKVYLAFASGTANQNATRIISATLNNTRLEALNTILTVSPSKDTPAHYGGKLQFLNDGTLLLTTGDGFQYREAAQDKQSQLGKILRLNSDGSVPDDNPYADGKEGNPYVYSYGHRSPQGLSYDANNNRVYMHEHGPKGGDEVNIINAAVNYGWPATSYGVNYSGARVSPFEQLPGIQDPLHYWVPSIAPSGMTFYSGDQFPQWQGDLFIGALVNKLMNEFVTYVKHRTEHYSC
jgi:glucose/arabinose dehydrogenase